MGLFTRKNKTEEEIQQEKLEKEKTLNDELNSLNESYGLYLNKLMMSAGDIFIFGGFKIKDNKIMINFITSTTPDGFFNSMEYYWFKAKYEQNPLQSRIEFLKFQKELNDLGFEIKKKG